MRNLFISLLIFIPSLLYAHGISHSDKEGMISGGLVDYIWLGASHMVTGYDHLLFLFGVIFFLNKFRDIVKFITAFTIGHSITLILATFMEITANYYLIDAVIALTVIYKGFDNLDGFQRMLKITPPHLLTMVFAIGLIHGFGLSTRLQQLPLGDDGLLLKIISFNIGVELGQIVALSILLMTLSAWRQTKSFKKFSVSSNILLMLAGLGLFGFQMLGYITDPVVERSRTAHGIHMAPPLKKKSPHLKEDVEIKKSIKAKKPRDHGHGHGHEGHHHH